MSKAYLFDGDIAVAGGGMAGFCAALALHEAGVKTVLIDAQPHEARLAPDYDGRTTALAYTSFRMFDAIGVGARLRPHTERIEDILVLDGRPLDRLKPGGPGPFSLRFDRREIHPEDAGEPLGWMAENRRIRLAMAEAAEAASLPILAPRHIAARSVEGAKTVLTLEADDRVRASVVIAADGKRSPLREAAGIRVIERAYDQTSIVCTVFHEQPHHGVAYEFFLPGGPFAILPLTQNRSSIVWTEDAQAAEAVLALDDEEFLEALRARFTDFLGALSLDAPRFSYPLSLTLAERFTDERLMLVGDAARSIHPIAGQGFNLGVRDAAAAAETIVEAIRIGLDPGSPVVLAGYERWRKSDSVLLAVGTDLFNTLFSNDIAPVRLARGLGLSLVDKIPAARRFFMREAGGETGDLPKPLRGEALGL